MIPPGYERLLLGHAVAVARTDLSLNIRRALVSADGTRCTLHEYAAKQPSARRLQGRDTAYAVPLPQCVERVVIRHNRHGGLFGALTRDFFLSPTRAPHELDASIRLASLGIPTPAIVAYALYPPGGLLQRSDIVSREIPGSRDLAYVLVHESSGERTTALASTAELLGMMARAGARHHDLNAKNVLLTNETAYVLDVDRVTFGANHEAVFEGNLARLNRSLRKWRDRSRAHISEKEIDELSSSARRAFEKPVS
jgi:tRNA A-37 threonylcarbamoyl transferase component Bud32